MILPFGSVLQNSKLYIDRFGLNNLSDEEYEQIKEVDDTLLYFELEALMDFLILTDRPYKTERLLEIVGVKDVL